MHTTKDFRDAKVGDFDVTLVGQKEVLKLDIPMSNAVVMQIGNTTKHLFEETKLVFLLQVSSPHQGIQFAVLAIFHDMVPATGMGTKSHCLDDVRMVQRLCNAVLRLHFSDILRFALLCGSF